MRRFIIILFCAVGIQIYAAENTPFASNRATAPAAAMRSVNNTAHMSSGSTYTPAVYAVGASNPAQGPHKAPPTVNPGTTTTDEFENPNYGPVGDALIPLMLMALAFVGYTYLRRRKQTN